MKAAGKPTKVAAAASLKEARKSGAKIPQKKKAPTKKRTVKAVKRMGY